MMARLGPCQNNTEHKNSATILAWACPPSRCRNAYPTRTERGSNLQGCCWYGVDKAYVAAMRAHFAEWQHHLGG